jgi:plasmid stabilization system protein ParE
VKEILWSEDALQELEDIVAYIARDNRVAADRVADRIERTVDQLAFMATGRRGRVNGTFEKVVSGAPYIIAYALGSTAAGQESLTVLRVIHMARDWPEGAWPTD